jgi:tetratricopeptide (TPR) repeat protein
VKALQLAPDLPEAHAREGEYQTFVRHDNAKALASYGAGLRLAPNNALLLDRIGFAEMRLGRWDSAVVHLRRATQLDPRSAVRVSDLSLAYWCLRRYAEAQSAAERAAVLEGGAPRLSRRRIGIALSQGNLQAAQTLTRSHSNTADLAGVLADIPAWVLDTQQLRALTTASSAQFGGDNARRSLTLSEAYRRLGDSLRAHSYADSAKAAYQRSLARTPNDPDLHSKLGLALAYLGQPESAVSEGRRAVEMLPISVDALAGPTLQENLARTYLLVGEPERAIETLAPLLKLPGHLSSHWLRIDPTFAALRGHPRFERLVQGS